MKYPLLTYFLSLTILFGCKNTPTFTVENKLDTLNENFTVPRPTNFTIKPNFTDDNRVYGFKLNWSMPEDAYFDGFILQLYDPEVQDFVKYRTFSTLVDSFFETSTKIPLELRYRIQSFIETGISSDLLSEPAEVSFKQNVKEINAYFINDLAIEITWQHEIYSNLRIIIERQINDGEYEPFRQPLTLIERRSLIDQLEPTVEDKIRYRAYAKTSFSETDTVFSNTISLNSNDNYYQ